MSGKTERGTSLPDPHRRKTPKANPDADETTCEECEATIEIGEETVTEAVVRHFKAEHGLGD